MPEVPKPDVTDIAMRDIVGHDRILSCGCHVIDGAICFVTPCPGLNTKNLYARPGRFIAVDGGATDARSPD